MNAAKSGDLSGWKLNYELDNGLQHYCLKDETGMIYEAYVHGRSVQLYDHNMQLVAA